MVKFDENILSDSLSFDPFLENEKVEESIGKTNKINPYSLLVDAFKEMTNHMEGHCSLEDITRVRDFFTDMTIESKNKAASLLNYTDENGSEYVSVTLPSSKKRKTHGTKHY